ncbi:MAG: hypothetical protein K2L55_05805 [Muribaculaceae bacterium]|nr:hypothetical protein [Muribaculaceae bacterium]
MNLFKSILACGAVVMVMAGCGTNEENYRKAYDRAKEKSDDGVESTIYNRVRERRQDEKIVLNGDTVAVVAEYVTAAKGAGFDAGQLKRYSVVAGQFKQLFHAKSMRNRMAAGGYDGAIIVETAEPLYYVAVVSTASLAEAKAVADSVAASSPVRLGEGFPLILRATNR